MVVDALELAFERDYISTFVLCTGDSDFTPLVHKLRELNKRVIGVGVEKSTSALLPPACDEFLFYDRLEGVEIPPARSRRSRPPEAKTAHPAEVKLEVKDPEPEPPQRVADAPDVNAPDVNAPDVNAPDVNALAALVAQTVAGMQNSSGGPVTASTLKRALLRKDPTFSEADFGFRAFGELLRHLADDNVVELTDGSAKGDPEVTLPEFGDRQTAYGLLRSVVLDLAGPDGAVALSGLKNQVRKVAPDFSEKKLGYRSFLQFCKAAATSGVVNLEWDAAADDYLLTAQPAPAPAQG
jgi:hypothetical protein